MKRVGIFILTLILILSLSACGEKTISSQSELSASACKLCSVFLDEAPGLGSEWLSMALYHNEFGQNSSWQKKYLKQLEDDLLTCGGIPGRKGTDYSSVVLGISAAGGNAASIGGYDLTAALNDPDFIKKQGINGVAYALLALDCGNYSSSCREEYIAYILSRQFHDGGFALSGERSDPDVTSMAIQALSAYKVRSDISAALEAALSCLSSMQREDGGYASWGTINSESSAQVILALCSMDIPLDDERFCKNGHTVMDNLLSYQLEDGTLSHEPGGEFSVMSSVQALLAISAVIRSESGGHPFDFAAQK